MLPLLQLLRITMFTYTQCIKDDDKAKNYRTMTKETKICLCWHKSNSTTQTIVVESSFDSQQWRYTCTRVVCARSKYSFLRADLRSALQRLRQLRLLRLAFGRHSGSQCLFVATSTYAWISIRPELTLLVARESSLPDQTFVHNTHVNIETDRHCSIAIGTGWISRNQLLDVVDGALLWRPIFDVDKFASTKRSLENHTLANVWLLLEGADPDGVNTSI